MLKIRTAEDDLKGEIAESYMEFLRNSAVINFQDARDTFRVTGVTGGKSEHILDYPASQIIEYARA
ncbi:MAG: hypothetical protein A2Y53_04125 [Chloroflexi bacterium RBG_16_47_49]|nr:MAG: hypothetical protein A2Y53_04125 [Chloroflexi bacterium RBG_16_47_49]